VIETASPAVVVEFPVVVDPAEAQLVDEVGNLWLVHSQAQTSLSKTRDELKLVRTDLSQRLHALKAVLARPGRGGAWFSFLQSQKIPRSTADRLVRCHERTTSADASCTIEQIQEPTEVVVHRYVHALWPRLSKILATRESVDVFIAELLRISERSFAGSSSLDSSSPINTSDLPSYLRHLDLPMSA